ncbi:MAG: hypothetical protein OEV28_07285 [Nitrospirota bacterium]|nr:hypothetical protein [Nitrospirota bacterium]
MYYRILLEKGHVGAGKSQERMYYSAGNDIISLYAAAMVMPGVKNKRRGNGVKLIEQISREEFLKGKLRAQG